MHNIILFVIMIFLSSCAVTGPLGKRLLKAKLISEEKKGALVMCIKAKALMYGGGTTAMIKLTNDFKGTVVVTENCGIKVNPKEDDTNQTHAAGSFK